MNRNLLAIVAIVVLLACGVILLWSIGDRAVEETQELSERVIDAAPKPREPSPPISDPQASPGENGPSAAKESEDGG